jgi:hypothetical protein
MPRQGHRRIAVDAVGRHNSKSRITGLVVAKVLRVKILLFSTASDSGSVSGSAADGALRGLDGGSGGRGGRGMGRCTDDLRVTKYIDGAGCRGFEGGGDELRTGLA